MVIDLGMICPGVERFAFRCSNIPNMSAQCFPFGAFSWPCDFHTTCGTCYPLAKRCITFWEPTSSNKAGNSLLNTHCTQRSMFRAKSKNRVLSLDSVYEYERAISETAHGTLLMHNTRSASGESHGVHYQLLSEPPMHAYGQRGFGAHLVHRGADRGIPRLLCTRCEGTFSARQGTA